MIKILHYIGSFELGGSQMMVMNIYRNIDRTKIQFDFVIHADGITSLACEAQSLGATIYTCPAFSLASCKAYPDWWRTFFAEHSEYSIVHSHVRSTAAIVLKIAKNYGLKTIAHSHSTSSGTGFQAVVKTILQSRIRYVADYFMGCSQVAGIWLFGKKVCESGRYFNVRNAIDTKAYIFDPVIAEDVRKTLGFSERDIIIGHVGRFSEPKNHMFLLDIFHALHTKNSAYKLLLVGDGELQKDVEQKIRDLDLQDAVTLTGVRSDVNRLLMAMDLFLFPSKWEGLPVSVVEAQAAGVPCVISYAITSEVCITPLVKRLSTDEPVEKWAAAVETHAGSRHEDHSEAIKNAGYDIETATNWISRFYCSLVESNTRLE